MRALPRIDRAKEPAARRFDQRPPHGARTRLCRLARARAEGVDGQSHNPGQARQQVRNWARSDLCGARSEIGSLPRTALNVLRSSKSVLQGAAGPYIWHCTFQARRNAHRCCRDCAANVRAMSRIWSPVCGGLLFGFQAAGCVAETNLWVAGLKEPEAGITARRSRRTG